MNRLKKATKLIVLLLPFVLLLHSPSIYSAACAEGISVWANCVLPSLYPFMIFSSLLIAFESEYISKKLKPLTYCMKLPPAAALCIALSLISGHPVGCRTLFELYNDGIIQKQDSTRISFLCSACGPMFLLGTIGTSLFKNTTAGIILLLSHLSGLYVTYLLLYPSLKRNKTDKLDFSFKKQTDVLSKSVQNSVLSILYTGGYIAFFSVIICAVEQTKLFGLLIKILVPLFMNNSDAARGFLLGTIEVTKGCAFLAKSNFEYALPCCAFLTTFGGASILTQQYTFLRKSNVNMKIFTLVKLIQSIAAWAICLLLCKIFYEH